MFGKLKQNKGLKRFLQIFAFMAIFGVGYTVFADDASAACMDTSGAHDYNWNLYYMCTDANVYGSGANTIDFSWEVDHNATMGETFDWKINLEIYDVQSKAWVVVNNTYYGYTSSSSPSYRSWNINGYTWLDSRNGYPGYANFRVRAIIQSGRYAGDLYYTKIFRVNDQG